MKLIDADTAYNELIDSIDYLRERDYDLYCEVGDTIRYVIDNQPELVELCDKDKAYTFINKIHGEVINDNRPQCCIDHDKWFSTCDTCEHGDGNEEKELFIIEFEEEGE